MRAVALLSAWKLKNAFRTLFSDPRKLIPVLVILICVPLSLYEAGSGLAQQRQISQFGDLDPGWVRVGISLMMILLGLSAIDTGLGDGILAFGLSDLDYLFPSPIPRRVVLLYRMPALLLASLVLAGFVLFMFNMATTVLPTKIVHLGHTIAPKWVPITAVVLSVGVYTNFATFLAVQLNDRRKIKRVTLLAVLSAAITLGAVCWFKGLPGLTAVIDSPWIKYGFWPATLAAETLMNSYAHRPTAGPLSWLLLCFAVSLIPVFVSDTNWYEQSIVSTERLTAFRQAAKGGLSGIMSARASSFKYKGEKPYTIPPFGQGAMAVFWAHLCAAAKRPWANFLTPVLAGAGAGVAGALANVKADGFGYAGIYMVVLYCSIGFIAAARTATEAAIRRRELLSPLPIPGWQSVAANLGVPFSSAVLFCLCAAIAYVASRGANWPLMATVLAIVLPMRLGARMVLQAIVSIAYPDVSDKIQQLFSQGIFWILSLPFLVIEIILCVPAVIFRSIWLGLLLVALFQIPLTALLLAIAGKASEKAVATGEPVRILSLLRAKR